MLALGFCVWCPDECTYLIKVMDIPEFIRKQYRLYEVLYRPWLAPCSCALYLKPSYVGKQDTPTSVGMVIKSLLSTFPILLQI
jgi:hypothetical protein